MDVESQLEEHHPSAIPSPFQLRFSHNIIEHLGLKLYQNKPTNVLAELVSNGWDADASNLWVHVRSDSDRPVSIAVADDGCGMSETALRNQYLIVGKPKRGDNAIERTPGGRVPMGRKGIGKLAPFGVARVVDLVTVQQNALTWLRFDYDAMLAQTQDPTAIATYEPQELARNIPLSNVDVNFAGEDKAIVEKFIEAVDATGSGTLVLATALTLRRALTPTMLLEALGHRFTVTLLHDDFKVHVNGELVQEKHAFPTWDIRIPAVGTTMTMVDTPDGPKELRHWLGFVKEAAWPQEEAGVGVYAHGKIAQDRPFFFGNRGNEVFSRYMYGVVEADWIDELDHDTISTDRTSVDWNDEALQDFHKWGQQQMRDWLRAYEKHRQQAAATENLQLVDAVTARNTTLTLRTSEKQHLVDLLAQVTPRMGRDADQKSRFVEATVKAWVHEPARRLIKRLWQQTAEFDANEFAGTVNRLVDELVPESLSLAVVFSQRVYALTQLEGHIMRGMETQLQKLIEEFPWILEQGYERFFARKALKTICEEAEVAGEGPTRRVHPSTAGEQMKPDFVFLSSAEDSEILIIELKGPKDTADWPEFEQLHAYMSLLGRRMPSSQITGILIAGNHAEPPQRTSPRNMLCMRWDDVLLRSRREHMKLLAALLAGTDADATDSRVQMVCELGGEPVKAFLSQMSEHDPELREVVRRLSPPSAAS